MMSDLYCSQYHGGMCKESNFLSSSFIVFWKKHLFSFLFGLQALSDWFSAPTCSFCLGKYCHLTFQVFKTLKLPSSFECIAYGYQRKWLSSKNSPINIEVICFGGNVSFQANMRYSKPSTIIQNYWFVFLS